MNLDKEIERRMGLFRERMQEIARGPADEHLQLAVIAGMYALTRWGFWNACAGAKR